MLSTIPFSGFYESWHDQNLDLALEQMFSDDNGDSIPDLVSEAYDRVNWAKVHLAYAQMYCDQFLKEAHVKGRFESIKSPREYNFDTDRIFIEIELDEVTRMFKEVDTELLRKLAEERFTSRSGFISFYDPNFESWGELADWDHNQIGTLVAAYAEEFIYVDDEYTLVEDANCNGWLDDMLCKSCDLSDLFDKLDLVRGGQDAA